MKKNTSHYKHCFVAAALFTIASFILLWISHSFLGFSNWYTEHIYPLFVQSLGRFWGILPYSAAESMLYILLAVLLSSFVVLAIKTIQKKAGLTSWRHYLSHLFLLCGFLLFLYTLCCGINYGRTSFSETVGIETSAYTEKELADLCNTLADELTSLDSDISRPETGISSMSNDTSETARAAMTKLGRQFPQLSGYYPKPKKLLFPALLSVQNLSGIYIPFTVEANYNNAMTAYNIPFTMCHELSHLRGFMQEEEANFIAFLACITSDSPEFRYSGYLMGWLYASNQLYDVNYELYQQSYDRLPPGARADLKANNAFWKKYEGRIAEVSNQMNDSYLKANGQADGVKSYDRMVDLMMAYPWK